MSTRRVPPPSARDEVGARIFCVAAPVVPKLRSSVPEFTVVVPVYVFVAVSLIVPSFVSVNPIPAPEIGLESTRVEPMLNVEFATSVTGTLMVVVPPAVVMPLEPKRSVDVPVTTSPPAPNISPSAPTLAPLIDAVSPVRAKSAMVLVPVLSFQSTSGSAVPLYQSATAGLKLQAADSELPVPPAPSGSQKKIGWATAR